MEPVCNSCMNPVSVESMMKIKTDKTIRYFCKPCLTITYRELSMRGFLEKDLRKLLKDIKKFLKIQNN